MIRFLQIENFKSLKKMAIPLEKMNLFFGMNGMGKSSVIQSLLLLRQSYWAEQPRGLSKLHINGKLVKLGTFMDILCQNADTESNRFFIGFEGDRYLDVEYGLSGNTVPASILGFERYENSDNLIIEDEPLFGGNFNYLSAEHIGPKDEYDASQWNREGINPLGVKGEYAVPFLAMEGEQFRVPERLCLDTGKTDRLFDQVSAWLSELSAGVQINARYLPFEEQAKLDFNYTGKRLKSTPFKPVNVGFGIPYVLPLIVALLTSKRNGLLLIENPESHLHPRGQSRMADLIARVCCCGTQVICESHSDHIINGIRIAVKDGILSGGDVSVVFFDKDCDQVTYTTEIAVDNNGNLSDYPQGLLDEWGLQMTALI